MKITKLTVSNVKRLRAVQITAGDEVVVCGDNGAGKSSVLDAIAMTLGGKELVCAQPVHNGADSGSSTVELDNGLVVRRTYGVTGTTQLTVTAKDGAKYSSPQGVLDALVGELAFDPLEFVRLDAKKQKDVVQRLVGLDFTNEDAKHKALFDRRTVQNREVERIKGVAESAAWEEDAPEVEVSVAELVHQLKDYQAHNAENERNHAAANALLNEHAVLEREVGECNTRLEKLRRELEEAQAAHTKKRQQRDLKHATFTEARTHAEKLADKDTESIVSKITQADAVNAKVRANRHHLDAHAALTLAKEVAAKMTTEMEAITKAKQAKLEAAKFPVSGMSFTDGGVLFNGLPFDQASTAEQVRMAVAVCCANNPKLKVVLIREGSLLDAKSKKALLDACREAGFQPWLEVVGDGGPSAVVIEAGEVVSAPKGEENQGEIF